MVMPAYPLSRCRIAVAVAALCSGLSPAWAEVSVTGSFGTGGYLLPIGPGSTDMGANTLSLPGSGSSSLLVNGGSFLKASSIRFADDPMGISSGVVDVADCVHGHLSGQGSRPICKSLPSGVFANLTSPDSGR